MKPISVTSSCPDNDKAQVEQRIINNCFTPATDSCSLRYQPLSLNYFFRPHETHFCTVVLWCTGNGLEFIEFWEYWADMLAYDGLLDRRIDRDGAGCETKLSLNIRCMNGHIESSTDWAVFWPTLPDQGWCVMWYHDITNKVSTT